jgi:CRP-like cAMP-binding protein
MYTEDEMDGSQYRNKLITFLETGKKLHFKRKETVLQTEPSREEGYYWIMSGYVKVCSYTKAGNERIHYIYGPYDLFPIGWTFSRPYMAVSFVAMNDVTLIRKTTDEFNDFIREEPFVMTEIVRMQLNMHDRIYNLNLDNAEERVAHKLLTFAIRFGVRSGEQVVIDIPLTQQELADTVRLSRETIGKILNDLEDKGYIILGRKRILVYNEKLSKMLVDL